MSKRTFDVLVGAALSLVAIPLICLMAFAVAVSLGAWPFFVQERIGQNGRLFKFLKIRTLPTSIPKYTDKYQFAEVQLPKLCRILRATHLDELPQLLLVPLGKMSLVGPRPKMPDHIEPVDAYYGAQRASVPQGCTGLWQIGADADRQVSESPEYDLFYVKHRTLRMDLWILWRTFANLAGLREPVRVTDVPASLMGRVQIPEMAADFLHFDPSGEMVSSLAGGGGG